MDDKTALGIQNGVMVAGDLAATIAPIVGVYNPAAGAALALLSPVVEKFVLNETQILLTLRQNMTKDEIVKALQDSAAPWGVKPLEIKGE